MSNHLYRTYKYFQHLLTARHSYAFGIHSPYIYHFTKFVIYEKNPFYIFSDVESIRNLLKKDNTQISVTDFGMGKSGEKTVKSIACKSLKSKKCGQLLFRIVNYSKGDAILELGTSLGITTAYLASANHKARCITMEGCSQIAKIARQTFDTLQLNNVEIITGDIEENLPSLLKSIDKIHFLFIDANHQSKSVLKYFEECLVKFDTRTILVVDDIYWSRDMEYAWKIIKEHGKVTTTIDLFHLGIVFFNTDLQKKNYKMRF